MSELLPCPFCGSAAIAPSQPLSTDSMCHTRCVRCGAYGPIAKYTHEGEKWNTRHIPEGYRLVPVELINKLLFAHGQSSVDWDAMRELEAMIEGEV